MGGRKRVQEGLLPERESSQQRWRRCHAQGAADFCGNSSKRALGVAGRYSVSRRSATLSRQLLGKVPPWRSPGRRKRRRCAPSSGSVLTVCAARQLDDPGAWETLIRKLEAARSPGIHIDRVDLAENHLSLKQLGQLFEVLDCVPVDVLKLRGCKAIGSDGTKLLAKWLRSREDALLELNLCECGITSQGFDRLLAAIEGNAVFPRVDPVTQKRQPVLLRVERNYITAESVLQPIRSGLMECAYKRSGELIAPVEDGVKVHLMAFKASPDADCVIPQKVPRNERNEVEAPAPEAAPAPPAAAAPALPAAVPEEQHAKPAPLSEAVFKDRQQLDEVVWQQLKREQLRPPLRAKVRRFFVAALRAATTEPGHSNRMSDWELLECWVSDACTRLHSSLVASPLEGVDELSAELLARVVEAVFRDASVELTHERVVEFVRERWEALSPQLELPSSPEVARPPSPAEFPAELPVPDTSLPTTAPLLDADALAEEAAAQEVPRTANAVPNGLAQRPQVGAPARRMLSAALKHAALFSKPQQATTVDEETWSLFLDLEEQAAEEARLVQEPAAEATPKAEDEDAEKLEEEAEDEELEEEAQEEEDVEGESEVQGGTTRSDTHAFSDEEVVAAVTDPYMDSFEEQAKREDSD